MLLADSLGKSFIFTFFMKFKSSQLDIGSQSPPIGIVVKVCSVFANQNVARVALEGLEIQDEARDIVSQLCSGSQSLSLCIPAFIHIFFGPLERVHISSASRQMASTNVQIIPEWYDAFPHVHS